MSRADRGHRGEAPGSGPLVHNVAGLLTDAPGTSRSIGIAGVMLDLGDLRQADPIEGTVRIARTNRGILVTGRLATALAEECSRCLRPIEVPVRIDLEEEVLPSIDIHSGAPVVVEADPETPRLTDHHEVDLEPLVREAIQLAEPIAPLCRADCPGLCVVCGGELATGDHDHPDTPVDPRLEALRAFRRDEDGETG